MAATVWVLIDAWHAICASGSETLCGLHLTEHDILAKAVEPVGAICKICRRLLVPVAA